MSNPRKIALDILMNIETKKAYSNLEISKVFLNKNITYVNKRFIRQLVYGVLENKIYLDYIISKLSNIQFKKINDNILHILRLGLYQIIFLDKTPNSAAVNESVKLAKKVSYRYSGFVNGVLRNFIRNRELINLPDSADSPVQYLSIKYSHPKWLVKKWIEEFGFNFTEELIKNNNEPPLLTIRVNTLKTSRDFLVEELRMSGVLCEKSEIANEAIVIKHLKDNIESLKAYKNGYFQIQDESSMLVGHVLSPKENEFIIDVCSAPGGKATHIAQLMNNKGKILSRDIHSHKLRLIEENAKRLGISIIETQEFNGLNLDENLINKADRVLIDAPCSGFGIIRRKPEIRYFRCLKDLDELTKLQYKLLNINSKYVKINGILVYSTCTIQKEENNLLIQNFLNNNSNFVLEDINKYLPHKIKSNMKTLQLYPHIHNTDGFFISRLKRIR